MNILNYLQKILTTYSSFEISLLIKSGIISASIVILSEIILFTLIKITDKKENLKHKILIISLYKGLRVFVRFLVFYIFLKMIKSQAAAGFPMEIIHRGIELVFLYAGLISAVFKIIKILKIKNIVPSVDSNITLRLVKISERGIRIIIILLVFSMFIRQLRNNFSLELQTELWMSMIILFNSILLIIAMFFAVSKILPLIQNFLNQDKNLNTGKYFISVVSTPLKLLIITIFIVSIKPLITGPAGLITIVSMLIELSISAAVLLFLYKLIEILISRLSKRSELDTNSLDKTLIEMIHMIIKVCFIAAFIFFSIKIITGKPLTSLLAGLGIGGLAVALAAQDTLKNFFGSIMIMTDKPFKVGERILADGYDGVIESIGFRSTRIRTLTGNQVVIPNDRVAQSPIENVGRRPSIRRLTNITITYNTPPEKVEKALEIIREILDNHEGMMPDFPPRVNFNEFNSDSLNIMMLYWYSPPDYWNYMRFTEEVNLKIMKAFALDGIEFAFPTHTTYIEQEDGKSIKLDINASDIKA